METRELLFKEFGLDKPLYQQYFIYLYRMLSLQLGVSYYYNVPLSQLLGQRFVNTLILLVPGLFLSIIIGIGLGVLAAWFEGGKLDSFVTSLSTLLWSTPSFWAGMVAIALLSVAYHVFPTGGLITFGAEYSDPFAYLGDLLYHLTLPLSVYAVIFSGQYTLLVRNTMSETLTEDYILLAKAKGLKGWQILMTHALRNALLPCITMVAVNIGMVILGSITIETVFTWPGIGLLVYQAIFFHDYPVLQATFFFFVVVTIVTMLVLDLVYMYVDPRVRFK